MAKKEFYIPSSDGVTKIHGYIWTPEGAPKFFLQLVHGMCEYIDRYDAFATFLTAHGVGVIGHDHLGHGKSVSSEEKLGYFAHEDGYKCVIEDMHKVTLEGKKAFPGVKNFILGHSMGSFMTRYYLTRHASDVNGAIIMGTGFIPGALAGVGKTASKLVRKTKGEFHHSKLLTALALGSNNKPFAPNRTAVDWLSRNEENVDRYVADPLCGFLFTAGAYVDFFTVLSLIAKQDGFSNIPKDLPILLTSGELDPVGGKAAVQKLKAQYDALGLTDVSVKLYPEDRHEILNEVDREQVYREILSWLTSKV